MHSGKQENIPYSISRWTDVPAGKWNWFKQQLAQGWMVAFDTRTAMPAKWSLKPEDTLGLILWTKDPTNLLKDRELLRPYPLVIHMTLTGWQEAEPGAPTLEQGCVLLRALAKAFGSENVVWRFSPIPQLALAEIVDRFQTIAWAAHAAGLKRVYAAFLQENDLLPETRARDERRAILEALTASANAFGLTLFLCQDDTDTPGATLGVCEDGTRFGTTPETIDCGCTHAVDPFTVNEACVLGCAYCYVSDKSLSPCKRLTT